MSDQFFIRQKDAASMFGIKDPRTFRTLAQRYGIAPVKLSTTVVGYCRESLERLAKLIRADKGLCDGSA